MLIKTSDLTSSALDWAVSLITNPDWGHDDRLINVQGYDEDTYQPSIEWAQGGPIIESEGITLRYDQRRKVGWEAFHYISSNHALTEADTQELLTFGPTPLIAAMRCYVASCLGDSINTPDDLIG